MESVENVRPQSIQGMFQCYVIYGTERKKEKNGRERERKREKERKKGNRKTE